ncbi:hypothetical protein GCM10010185_26100 [Saccharothrix coeruleofusca]|uniref:Secreted protein n=2 Tax=Saccharothrix coeruleofusca TaxID=33919 RepID=A0A918AKG0_9PSEU|nr:hypothetical protein GCM10010185_26100 [Saccharothrix coeruleofusca]
MIRNTRAGVVRLAAATAAVAFMFVGTGSIANAAMAADKPCGYSESEGSAWYNHCTSDGSKIWIKIDVVAGLDSERCVNPGTTKLGPAWSTRGAWYDRLCNR